MKTTLLLAIPLLSALPLMGAETLKIEPKTSKVTFTIKNKAPGSSSFQDVPGSFKDFSGTIMLDSDHPSKSSVKLEVKTTSVDTGNAKRDDHLRNQDFFKVKEYPMMSFKSSKVSKGDKGHYTVEGEFKLLGKTKKIEVTFEPTGEHAGKTSFTIKRSDYGMSYRIPDTADEVEVTLEIAGQ